MTSESKVIDLVWSDIDDDDDDDDDINVVLYKNNETPTSEKSAISKIFEEEKLNYKNYLEDIDRATDDIRNEHKKLVAISLLTTSKRSIILKSGNVYITIPDTVEISPTFRDHVWPPSDAESSSAPPLVNIEIFNALLQTKPKHTGTLGFFAAHYSKVAFASQPSTKDNRSNRYGTGLSDETFQKNITNFRNKQKFKRFNNWSSQQQQTSSFENNVIPLMCFDDFSLVIVKDGIVIDAAIHGYRGHIPDLVNKYKPSKIYYVARENDPFDVFVQYKYNPFHASFNGLTTRLQNMIINTQLNTTALCDRKQSYCSYCRALQIVYSYTSDLIAEEQQQSHHHQKEIREKHSNVIHSTGSMKRIILKPMKRSRSKSYHNKTEEPKSVYSVIRDSTNNTLKRRPSDRNRRPMDQKPQSTSYREDRPPKKIRKRSQPLKRRSSSQKDQRAASVSSSTSTDTVISSSSSIRKNVHQRRSNVNSHRYKIFQK